MQVFNIINKKASSKALYLLVFITAFTLFYSLGKIRLIAKDEGFYAMAVDLVLSGKHPYFDFFYPQMPFLPYFYGVCNYLFDLSFLSLRTITAIITSLIACIIFSYSKNKFGLTRSVIIFTLFLFCSFNLMWFSVIQTYALSTLFLLLSTILLTKGVNKNSSQLIILSAIFFSLSVSVRLFFAGLFPLLLIFIYFNTENKKYIKKNLFNFSFFGLLSGFLLTVFFLIDFETFYFNNIGYHLNRSSKTFIESIKNKKIVLSVIFGLKNTIKFESFHIIILNYLSVFGFLYLLIKAKKKPLSIYILFGLLILNIIPNPTYVQYFATSIPFLFLFLIDITPKEHNKFGSLLIIIISILFIPGIYKDLEKYTKTGIGVIGVSNQQNAEHWNLKNLNFIQNKLNESCLKNECRAISLWPGYLVGTKIKPISGYENHFANLISKKMGEEEKNKFKLKNNRDILKIAQNKKPDFIILNNKVSKLKSKRLKNLGYSLIYDKRLINIFSLN